MSKPDEEGVFSVDILATISDDVLAKELARRKKEREEKALAEREKKNARMVQFLRGEDDVRGIIDYIAPMHRANGCSDENHWNTASCQRCTILYIFEEGWISNFYEINIAITVREVK